MLIAFRLFIPFIDYIVPGDPYALRELSPGIENPDFNSAIIPFHLSMFHTVFNIINVLLLIWFVPQIASIVKKMVVPSEEEKEEDEYKLEYFSTGVQPVPEIAIIEAKKEVIKMSNMMNKMLSFFYETFTSKKNISQATTKARKIESRSDQMQEQICTYLAECTKHELSIESSKGAATMSRITNELESVGDSSLNLFLQIERLDNEFEFKDVMNNEITNYHELVLEFIKWNESFISQNIKSMTSQDLEKSIKYERKIDDRRNKLIDLSRKRLTEGSNAKAELLFMDIAKHLEHIGDYSLNISQALEQI